MNKLISLLFFAVFCFGMILKAQDAIPATGGNASGSGGSASYTIGQVVYTTNTGTAGSVAQGVQQSFEITIVTVIEAGKGISLNCIVYPNPVTDYLVLKIEGEAQKQYIASIFDINGKLIENIKVESNDTKIDMGNLVPATYFLKVTQGEKEIKTFKIIKH